MSRLTPLFLRLAAALALLSGAACASRTAAPPVADPTATVVPAAVMEQIHAEVQTPYKYGVILRGGEGELLDCPNIFRHEGHWYMMYVANRDKVGYQTFLARSDDLLHWDKLGPILSFSREGWDAWQADGGIALYDTRWEGGTHGLGKYDGRYWLSYIGGAQQGYEPDPLSIGLATSTTPAAVTEWTRIPENPVLSPADPGVRPFESTTLYKSAIIRDDSASLGAPFVMFYNAKSPPDGHEVIGMATSQDMRTWQRYGDGPVVANVGESRWAISGDPQITRIGDVWVMFYFGAFWQPNAFDTFACSYDLKTWTKWDGPHLIEPSEPYDQQFAHKPWVLKHDGVVYHYYCAVGDQGRVIALATSRDLGTAASPPPVITP